MADSLCKVFGRDYDVPGGDYNRNSSTRRDYKACESNGHCPCQADCDGDPECDAWTVIPVDRHEPRCCLKKFAAPPRVVSGPAQKGFITGVKDPHICNH
eukprot:COSAG06_NODE_2762_length_6327_cov_5.664740_7_plen_99_part_00